MDSFFEKEIYNISDIDLIIENKTQESYGLEFKSAKALENLSKNSSEFTKDISSFANSAGGIIIYGIDEIDHVAQSKSYVDGRKITKEFLENIIDGNIHRRLNVTIYPITDLDIAKTIYLIKIPESENAPHQNSDKAFYKRYNFKSSKMEEHEIRNLFLRAKSTKLKFAPLGITMNSVDVLSIDKIRVAKYELKFNIENYGLIPEAESKIILKIPYILINKFQTNNSNQKLYSFLNRTEAGYEIFSIPIQQTLFPDEQLNICKCFIQITFQELAAIKTLPLIAKLYYSGGQETLEYNLLDIIEFNGYPLGQYEFIDNRW